MINEKKVKFKSNNIFEYGVAGVFEDINKKYSLPEELYMSGDFMLKYNSEGTIKELSTFVYGKDESGKDITCLIYYNRDISKNITIRVNGYADTTYDNSKLVQPLIETVDAIQLEKLARDWKAKEYSLNYQGKVSQGYNTDGVVNINELGIEEPLEMAMNEIIGYTVSITAPGNDEKKYNLICDSQWSKPENLVIDDSTEDDEQVNEKEQFYLSKEVGYRLNFEDAAAGSTFYSLSKTSDGGQSWEIINEDPFGGTIGGAAGIVFINEEIGFMAASRNGGSNGELYQSTDGGKSFSIVSFTPYEVTLDNGESFSPYDFPEMPYEENGVLNVLLGQGADGDYNGNSKGLYQSKDNGQTWEFIKEVKVEIESVD